MLLATVAGSDVPHLFEKYFDVHTQLEMWWLIVGLLGQMIFFSRWVIQWIASERRRESHMPIAFWWCSLIGATILLAYFIGRKEPIGVLGQLTGWTIYIRNLYLIRSKNQRLLLDEPSVEDSTGA